MFSAPRTSTRNHFWAIGRSGGEQEPLGHLGVEAVLVDLEVAGHPAAQEREELGEARLPAVAEDLRGGRLSAASQSPTGMPPAGRRSATDSAARAPAGRSTARRRAARGLVGLRWPTRRDSGSGSGGRAWDAGAAFLRRRRRREVAGGRRGPAAAGAAARLPRVPSGITSASATARHLPATAASGRAAALAARCERAKSANASAVVYAGRNPSTDRIRLVSRPRPKVRKPASSACEALDAGLPRQASPASPARSRAPAPSGRPSRRSACDSISTPSPATLKVPCTPPSVACCSAPSRSSSCRNWSRASNPSTVGTTGSRK